MLQPLPASKARCTVCSSDQLEAMVEFGNQPLSTRFGTAAQPKNVMQAGNLSLGYCTRCAAMQLVDRFPLGVLQQKFPAVRFREPKDHLPALVSKLSKLDGVSKKSSFLGLSYIDNDLLDLLAMEIQGNYRLVDYTSLSGWKTDAGLETIQALLTNAQAASRIKDAIGEVDVLSARFILEHAESAIGFLNSLMGLVRPGGYIVIEVPDAKKMLAVGNHALIWEDHFTYFTERSLSDLISKAGATLVDLCRYPYAYEDALAAILRVTNSNPVSANPISAAQVVSVRNELSHFANGFEARKRDLRKTMIDMLRQGERLAIFGAGHHAAKFINFYGISDLLDCIIDDNPIKAGLYMPGTDLMVRDSKYLLNSSITTCFSTLSPDTESRVRQSLEGFFGRGGKFIPAFHVVGAHDDK